MKSAGQVGYEAYYAHTRGLTWNGNQMPAWSELPHDVMGAWEAAAGALLGVAREAPKPYQAPTLRLATREQLEEKLANAKDECTCSVIQALDQQRHFKGCPVRKPLPPEHPHAPTTTALPPPVQAALADPNSTIRRDTMPGERPPSAHPPSTPPSYVGEYSSPAPHAPTTRVVTNRPKGNPK